MLPKPIIPSKCCKGCGLSMDGMRKRKVFCTDVCRKSFLADRSEAVNKERSRPCEKCGSIFAAKKSQIDSGYGKFCSRSCASGHLTTLENLSHSAQRRRDSVAEKGTKHKKGEESPLWKGGKAMQLERYRERNRLYLKARRASKPDQAREYARKRRGKMIGRLPRGTVSRIGEAQKWKCIACKNCIKDQYHVDHTMPLAKGGEHEPRNLQLLCPTCNLTKSAKHPIDFMQEKGFLL